ncbi:hypothetical protein RB595_008979 [Gaeumannomyces hyphopodioides]
MAYIPASMVPMLLALLSYLAFLADASSLQGMIVRRGVLGIPDMSDATELRHFELVRRQSAQECGPQGGNRRCPNNLCCSDYGWCGDSLDHCDLRWCQAQFGRCGDAPPPPTTTSTTSTTSSRTTTSTSATSTTSSRTTTSTSATSTTSTSPPLPGGTLIVSPNGQCGNVTTCAGSGFGNCCSEWYWCGNGPEYCAAGCRSAFGSCGGVISSSSSSSSTTSTATRTSSTTSTVPSTTTTSTSTSTSSTSLAPPRPSDASTDGRCGPEGGRQRCTGSDFGPCCSDYGWCGEGADHCDARWCQAAYGICG